MLTPNIAMAGSPVAWGVLIVVAVMVFAPRMLPAVARFLAHMAARDIRRKLGIPIDVPPRPSPRKPPPEVEIIPPPAPQATLRAGASESLSAPRQIARNRPIWPVVVVVSAAVAVLLWYLLHSR